MPCFVWFFKSGSHSSEGSHSHWPLQRLLLVRQGRKVFPVSACTGENSRWRWVKLGPPGLPALRGVFWLFPHCSVPPWQQNINVLTNLLLITTKSKTHQVSAVQIFFNPWPLDECVSSNLSQKMMKVALIERQTSRSEIRGLETLGTRELFISCQHSKAPSMLIFMAFKGA